MRMSSRSPRADSGAANGSDGGALKARGQTSNQTQASPSHPDPQASEKVSISGRPKPPSPSPSAIAVGCATGVKPEPSSVTTTAIDPPAGQMSTRTSAPPAYFTLL